MNEVFLLLTNFVYFIVFLTLSVARYYMLFSLMSNFIRWCMDGGLFATLPAILRWTNLGYRNCLAVVTAVPKLAFQ